jgi:hypothetical protein
MQHSNFREIRRLTSLLRKIKRYERQMEAFEKTAEPHDVLEKKGLGFSARMSKSFILFNERELDGNAGTGEKKVARHATMFKKQKGLAMTRENLEEIYIIENKIVSFSLVARVMR